MNRLRSTRELVVTLGGLLAVTSAALPQDATAAEVNFGVNVGAAYSDNINRTADNKDSDTIGTLGFTFDLSHESRRLTAFAVADMAYETYFQNSYDDSLIGGLSGEAAVKLIPERLEWIVEDNFGQARVDRFAAETADNRENINYFSTGPDLSIPFTTRMRMKLSGRYENVAYETSPIDNNRVLGRLALIRDISSTAEISLNGDTERVKFSDNDTTASDYDRSNIFARYAVKGSRTDLSVDLGYAMLSNDGQDSNGMLARLDLSRRVSRSSTFSFRAAREFSDAGDQFRSLQNSGGVGQSTEPVQQTGDPFRSDSISAGWNFSHGRTGLEATLTRLKETHESNSTEDRTRSSADARFKRQLARLLSFDLRGSYSRERFDVPNRDFNELNLSAGLAWQLSRKFTLDTRYERISRDADRPVDEFDDNRLLVTLSYGWRPGLSLHTRSNSTPGMSK